MAKIKQREIEFGSAVIIDQRKHGVVVDVFDKGKTFEVSCNGHKYIVSRNRLTLRRRYSDDTTSNPYVLDL